MNSPATVVRTALIIGAGGQDGTIMAGMLLAEGAVVHATGRSLGFCRSTAWSALKENDRLYCHALDPENGKAVQALVAALRPDRIFCLTGQSSVGQSFAIPGPTLRSHFLPIVHVAEAAMACGLDAHIIYAGSGDVFGETTIDQPAVEDSHLRPVSPYGAGKAAGVVAARALRDAHGLRLSIAHLFGHESANRPAHFVFGKVLAAIRAIRDGETGSLELGRGDIVRDWGWAPDYVAAMITMAECDAPNELVLATGQSVRLDTAVAHLFAAAGLDAQAHVVWDVPQFRRPGDIVSMTADPGRARALIGWTGSTAFPDLAERLIAGSAG